MRIEYDLTFADFAAMRHAQATVGGRVAWYSVLGGFGLICFGIGGIAYQSREAAGWWVLPLLFVVICVAVPWLNRWELRRLWRRTYGRSGPHVVAEFGDAGILSDRGTEREFIHWYAFSHYREGPHVFLFYKGPTLLRGYVPKGAFADADEVGRFRALLEEKIGRTTYSPEPPGFPVQIGGT